MHERQNTRQAGRCLNIARIGRAFCEAVNSREFTLTKSRDDTLKNRASGSCRRLSAVEEFFPRIDRSTVSENPTFRVAFYPQIANCKTNADIAYVAQGDVDRALQLWSETDRDKNKRVIVSSTVLAYRESAPGIRERS